MEITRDTVVSAFVNRYGTQPKWLVAAPGRVNLIGEHTDYNEGFVFPMAIERYTWIAAAPWEDSPSPTTASVFSLNMKEEAAIVDLSERVEPTDTVVWSSYVQGVVTCARNLGFAAAPFRAVLGSSVPLGGGLSSSASLEVATATLLEAMNGRKMNPTDKALVCQAAEHQFAKMPCGIMDQFISVYGQSGHAMLLDCRTKKPFLVSMEAPNIAVLIANTNVKHALTGSEYPQRRAQCFQAAEFLGQQVLRDVTLSMLEQQKKALLKTEGGELSYRRARHVISENDRTCWMAAALAESDWVRCGELMFASHDSLRDDFEVSCNELDIMVEIAKNIGPDGGVYGSRMTGGGFGGCTVSLVKTESVPTVTAILAKEYKAKTGIHATIFATRPTEGAVIL